MYRSSALALPCPLIHCSSCIGCSPFTRQIVLSALHSIVALVLDGGATAATVTGGAGLVKVGNLQSAACCYGRVRRRCAGYGRGFWQRCMAQRRTCRSIRRTRQSRRVQMCTSVFSSPSSCAGKQSDEKKESASSTLCVQKFLPDPKTK